MVDETGSVDRHDDVSPPTDSNVSAVGSQRVGRLVTPEERWIVIAVVLGLVGMLAVARWLEPSKAGYGTHQQLGLPPCSSFLLFGAPCPACGMTTSWSLLVRGRFSEAFAANAGGALLVLIALASIPSLCYYVFKGRWSYRGWFSMRLAVCLAVALVVSVMQWLLRDGLGR